MADEWMEHMQRCECCEQAIVFVPDILSWVAAVNGVVKCERGPEGRHFASREEALRREREIAIKKARYPGLPYTTPMF